MSNLPFFGTYAAAFEESLQDDNWDRLSVYFTPDASYQPGDGTHAHGREAVLKALQHSVESLERKCDARELIGTPELSEQDDTVTLKYTIKYTKAGSDDYLLVGVETIKFAHGAIHMMEDAFEDPEGLLAWQTSL